MADLILNVTIKDIDVAVAVPAFLRKLPKEPIEDIKNPGEIINDPTTKQWAEECLRKFVLRVANYGIDLIAQDGAEKLTKAIFG